MTSDRPRVKFVTAIIADDIRREDTGKEIYVGVYNDNMLVERVERKTKSHLSISIILEVTEIGEIPIQVNVLGPRQSDDGYTIKGRIMVHERPIPNAYSSITLSMIPVSINTSGDIIVRARNYEDEEWKTIRVLPVNDKVPEP